MANWPTWRAAVTGSGGKVTALRCRYCLWAATAALWARDTWRCTAVTYYVREVVVGSGMAEAIAEGGEDPNMRMYGAHPTLLA
jgi:hypothetical protein